MHIYPQDFKRHVSEKSVEEGGCQFLMLKIDINQLIKRHHARARARVALEFEEQVIAA